MIFVRVVHDHFVCSDCDGLMDIKIADEMRKQIAHEISDCYIDGPLVVTGVCKKCQKKEEIMALYEITTKQEFEDKVLRSDGPVLVGDFWAPWLSAMSCNGSAFASNC
ncbi:hypothetical protein [Candidatus Minimicrobia naudis]